MLCGKHLILQEISPFHGLWLSVSDHSAEVWI